MPKNKPILRILPFYKSGVDYNICIKAYNIRKKRYLKRSNLLNKSFF